MYHIVDGVSMYVYNIIGTNRSPDGRLVSFVMRLRRRRGGWGFYGMEPEISGFGRFISEYNTVKFSFRNGAHTCGKQYYYMYIFRRLILVKIGRRDPFAERI
jgi:hypothetical protein